MVFLVTWTRLLSERLEFFQGFSITKNTSGKRLPTLQSPYLEPNLERMHLKLGIFVIVTVFLNNTEGHSGLYVIVPISIMRTEKFGLTKTCGLSNQDSLSW
ncbi:hypothetical protein CEXT_584022 [Caerostris extrusa]|uniref:Uncharacterized protein n=1 Tax=Caerostris extrusa TaxID=172846 RepID=A0AAV4RXX6_CAEEX|nr:hypothetical protein CEXT_584022 [Caerostris extrusa]